MFFKETPLLEKQGAFYPIKLDIGGDRFRRGLLCQLSTYKCLPINTDKECNQAGKRGPCGVVNKVRIER